MQSFELTKERCVELLIQAIEKSKHVFQFEESALLNRGLRFLKKMDPLPSILNDKDTEEMTEQRATERLCKGIIVANARNALSMDDANILYAVARFFENLYKIEETSLETQEQQEIVV